MQLRTSHDATDISLTLTTENGGIVLGDSAGTIELTITAEDSAALTSPLYVYDLEIVWTENEVEVVKKLVKGKLRVKPEVTR
jgi:tRNA threonylcarbamoyladenosine modification (KEOPS) complex  Pcc1 subunit